MQSGITTHNVHLPSISAFVQRIYDSDIGLLLCTWCSFGETSMVQKSRTVQLSRDYEYSENPVECTILSVLDGSR
eukprot:scaffold1046_cov172-Amphora_coffeaeformis.AAC.16